MTPYLSRIRKEVEAEVCAKNAPKPKWTLVNDEWVQVWCEISRKGSGYVETPAITPSPNLKQER